MNAPSRYGPVQQFVTQPTVSVLIAAYNAEDTIALAVRSALEQTDHLHEVIVVDDASTDRTLEVLQAIDDPRLMVLRQPARQGPGAARNRAMEEASGQWMAILDADDAFEPQRLQRIFATLPYMDGRVVLGDQWLYCHSRGVRLVPFRKTTPFSPVMELKDFLVHKPFLVKPILPASVRELGIRYPDYFSWEDAVFMCRVLARGYRLLLHQEPLYLYRLRSGSLSHDLGGFHATEAVFTELLDELEPVLDQCGRQEILDFICKAQDECFYLPVLEALRQRRYGLVARQLLADRACRREFLRRLWPSMLRRLRMLRYPGTTGR